MDISLTYFPASEGREQMHHEGYTLTTSESESTELNYISQKLSFCK